MFCIAPVVLYFLFNRNRKRSYLFSGGLIVAACSFVVLSYMYTPTGENSKDARVQSIFLQGPGYQRSALSNIIPEIDQFKLGTYLIPLVDSKVDREQSLRIRELFLKVYCEMRADKDFEELGSVMNYSYENLFNEKQKNKHFYKYVPESVKGKAAPVLIFLHGSGGNFKGYLWKLKSLADLAGIVIIAPSFGFGNWDQVGSKDLMKEVLNYCDSSKEFIARKKFLCGLSNGGTGVYKLGAEFASDFDGLVFISPVMRSKGVSDKELAAICQDKPVLILSGDLDRRVPKAFVENREKELSQLGMSVQMEWFAEEDHFLFFSAWPEVEHILDTWLKKVKAN
jgi:predicted esterase